MGHDVLGRHHILGQLEEAVVVAPHEIPNGADGEGLLIEDAKHGAESQTSQLNGVLHLIRCRLA